MQSESFSVTCATLVCLAININGCCHPFPHTRALYNPFCIYPHERDQAERHHWQPSAESPKSLAYSPTVMLANKCPTRGQHHYPKTADEMGCGVGGDRKPSRSPKGYQVNTQQKWDMNPAFVVWVLLIPRNCFLPGRYCWLRLAATLHGRLSTSPVIGSL